MVDDLERAILIAEKWANDPRRHPYSEKVILARGFLELMQSGGMIYPTPGKDGSCNVCDGAMRVGGSAS